VQAGRLMDSFLFEMVGLDGGGWSGDDAVGRLVAAVGAAGSAPEEPSGGWHRLGLVDGPLAGGSLLVSAGRPGWAFSIVDQVLGGDDDPIEEAQAAAVDLLRRCVAAVPLYLGTAVWPFGPEVPEVYDTRRPFTCRQAGPVMYVSGTYVDAVLGNPIEALKGWTSEPVAGGHLLVVRGNLLREAETKRMRRLLRRLQLGDMFAGDG
jgi:hypothetical protein